MKALAFLLLLGWADTPQSTAGAVDLKRYAGRWYEIARYPNRFQKQCTANVTATYTLKPNGRLEVVNACTLANGATETATGEGRVADQQTRAKLQVRFAPRILSFLSAVWGDYWIIELDPEYRFAVVGHPQREYFWILSRTPALSAAVYDGIVKRAAAQGYEPARIQRTPQAAAAR